MARSHFLMQPWILHTGANHHLTLNLDNLTRQSEYTRPEEILISDGTKRTSNSTINGKVYSLMKTLLVPSSCHYLLSMSDITKSNHPSLKFFPDCFIIKDLVTRRILHKGKARDGLYSFPISFSTQSSNSSSCSSLYIESWHAGSGHANFKIVKQVLHQFKIYVPNNKFELFCQSCCVRKSHHLPFTSSNFVVNEPLALIC